MVVPVAYSPTPRSGEGKSHGAQVEALGNGTLAAGIGYTEVLGASAGDFAFKDYIRSLLLGQNITTMVVITVQKLRANRGASCPFCRGYITKLSQTGQSDSFPSGYSVPILPPVAPHAQLFSRVGRSVTL